MAFNPHRARIESVTVEWDGPGGQRKTKTFEGDGADGAARRHYRKMMAAGKNPRVTGGKASR